MSVSVHNHQSSLDNFILEGVAAAQELSIFVHHRGRWIRGCRASSLKHAAELADVVFHRSGLPVEVRGQGGQPLLEIDEHGARRCNASSSDSDALAVRELDPGQRPVCVR